MKVLIVPEDPTYDRHILKPIAERLFSDLSRPARIGVLARRLEGVEGTLGRRPLADVVEDYPMVDLFLVLIDRDGDLGRKERADAREMEHPGRLLVCLAIEEIEVWMLALHRGKLAATWSEIRAEHHPKERFAEPFLRDHAPKPDPGPGRGRKWAMRSLGGSWKGLLEICPELAELRDRLRAG